MVKTFFHNLPIACMFLNDIAANLGKLRNYVNVFVGNVFFK